MNKINLSLLLVMSSFNSFVQSSDKVTGKRKFNRISEEKPNTAEVAKMQNLLFGGAKVANFAAVKKSLNTPGVDINAKNKEGETALTLLANRTSDQDVVKKITNYLLCRGADLNIKNSNGKTAMEIIENQRSGSKYLPENTAFLEAVQRWQLSNFEAKLRPYLNETNLPTVLCSLISEYAYESPDQEKQESEK